MRETLKHQRQEDEFRRAYDAYCGAEGLSTAAALAYWHSYEDMLDKFLNRPAPEVQHDPPDARRKILTPEHPVVFARFIS
jgi:hypothetical protein